VIVDAVVIMIALIGPAVDLIARRRIHIAYMFGIGTILLVQVVTDILSPTPVAAFLLRAVGAG
jgi:hypothetical protein